MMLVAAMICGCFACDDEFLERYPHTSVAPPTFFKSVSDLELYVNGLYSVNPRWNDMSSDNVSVSTEDQPYTGLLYGRLTPDNVSGDGWNWSFLRNVNLMLGNLDEVSGDAAEINHYVGIARYLRARFYIGKVQIYSDVPWYDKELTTTDEDLYKTQDPRTLVVDKIMEDLEFAVANIKPDMGNNRTRMHKYVALAEVSRFALYEGTYRKYHTELELTGTANRFLERSVSASEEIMNSGNFEITGTGVEELAPGIAGCAGFRALFSSAKLGDNREIIQWKEHGMFSSRIDNRANSLTESSKMIYSLSRSLQESFLTKDGKPFSTVADYDKKEYKDVFTDRDPRMAETFFWPGLGDEDAISPKTIPPSLGGYWQSKYFTPYAGTLKAGDNTWQITSLPVFRYGEVLLNYAEAKAELGQLDAAAINRSINLLRARVNMPAFNAANEVDAMLRSLYPNVSDVNILAVRRERRVELAGEGLRQQDIYRWKAGKLFEAEISQQGIYIPSLPFAYDTNGDGILDSGVAETSSKHIATDDPVVWYDLDDPDGLIYRDASGFIRIKNDQTRSFVEPKCYYTPIPTGQIVLNPNLKQPPGW
jgi:hypothetical protein